MGKRSNFARIEKDYYRTFDPRAGNALRPYLPESARYAEPFAGAGDLIDQFPTLNWVVKSDLEPNRADIKFQDAFAVDILGNAVDVIVTNPPWTRTILHEAIEHFAPLAHTWFLFDSAWAYTKQAQPYLKKYCTDIIPVGRLKWIPDTTMSGKDDCSWYKFDGSKLCTETIKFRTKLDFV